jgi:Rod binding domain-containing protein
MHTPSSGLTHAYTDVHLNDRPVSDINAKTQEASQAFEAMFVNEIFKIMRRTMPNSQSDFGQKMFTEMFDEQISKHVAEAGLGLQDVLRDDLGEKTTQGTASNVDRA